MSRRAVILAGGMGTRLRPYTVVLPKPLMPIGDYPILEVIIRQLISGGFQHITLAVNHQAELIKAFFQDGDKWGVRIDYSLEDEPLGTMGPLRLIKDLPENFLVMNGDILTDLNYADFHDAHVRDGNIFTISSKTRQHRIDYGVLDTNEAGRLTGFREKPTAEYKVSMGVYMVSSRAVEHIPHRGAYGFDQLMLDLLAAGKPATVRDFPGYWLDIGRPDDYAQAIEQFENMQSRFLNG
ncbi:nucleotidyltransferase family protein [Rhizobium bangladeshense]|uniref:Nucleotidyltransferase family protein n=1 Tax=Rhizobium bangladeshense TaxID=1138189 RepID=A0ABS7LDF4_9HYPH|nr:MULTISPECIES: nucleotidyltransferase family protein [Rhizobium]MBX4865613.1 nucleotidyltransferase family protein [Rhizobium bangladeshense]MBX4875457.1 nucleotidyltransferase family protein [Rhizobium bangladeshense]MBX4882195.1 nucleotidyltransferase family protein [Rhizobium bangladeshense]MBX4896307.1 nucleotidyltransferase family protein [Rhizobium bangladeshense]MBX4902164.1 nucleotidyltransferase family protein [Rhizobium bangladeshense]